MYEVLEKPLPKPTTEEYASARLLEAVTEAYIALRFVKDGLIRNAAGKAFQAWRAILAALLRLELERLKTAARAEEEKRWLEEKAAPRVPTSRMKELSSLLEAAGYADVSLWTSLALDLHDYQYHGPDPDVALSKYKSSRDAVYDVLKMAEGALRYALEMRKRVKWDEELEAATSKLREEIEKVKA
ncbi:MAG: PaREP1 family protein [Pyrobaculum sp.]